MWTLEDFEDDGPNPWRDRVFNPPQPYSRAYLNRPLPSPPDDFPPDEELMLAMGCRVVKATRHYAADGSTVTYHSPKPTLVIE